MSQYHELCNSVTATIDLSRLEQGHVENKHYWIVGLNEECIDKSLLHVSVTIRYAMHAGHTSLLSAPNHCTTGYTNYVRPKVPQPI